MTSIATIGKERDAAFLVIDTLLMDDRVSEADKDKLQAVRTQIGQTALNAILASSELADAVKVLAQVATNLQGVASNEQVAAELVGDFAGVLGKAKALVTAAKGVLGNAAD